MTQAIGAINKEVGAMTKEVAGMKRRVPTFTLIAMFATLAFVARAETAVFTTYQDPDRGFVISYPADWEVEATIEGLEISKNDTAGFLITALEADAMEMEILLNLPIETLVSLFLTGFQQEFPEGFELTGQRTRSVSGASATEMGFSGFDPDDRAHIDGAVLLVRGDADIYLLIQMAAREDYQDMLATFDQMVDSFLLPAVARSATEPVAVVQPESVAPPVNPLAPQTISFVGTYSSDRLTLVLEADGADYSGRILFGDRVFPVRASARDAELAGTFEADGHDFEFTATMDANVITFVTGETTYVLTAEVAPINPLE